MSTFTVKISKVETVVKTVGREWEVIGQEEHTGSSGDTTMIDKRGYTPEIQKSVEVETDVYSQVVEDMDLSAVIKAINGI